MEKVIVHFNNHIWHDSRVMSIKLQKAGRSYEVLIEILFVRDGVPQEYESENRIMKFDRCRIFSADIDLLGLELCGGMIGSARCRSGAIDIERQERGKIDKFDLPQDRLPLDQCLVFEFELIYPAGNITLYAENFEIA